MQAIRVENLSKTFRVKRKEKGMRGSIKAFIHPRIEEIQAVNGVSFSVEEGEMLAFIGPNGAGKSTDHQDADRDSLSRRGQGGGDGH